MSALAIDIGASSGRHILGWIENGELKHEEIHRFPNAAAAKPLFAVDMHSGLHVRLEASSNSASNKQEDVLCWNINALFDEIIIGMKKCAAIGKIPKSVGISTWGVDYVPVAPATPAEGNADYMLSTPHARLEAVNGFAGGGKLRMIGEAVSYRDSRTIGMEEEISRYISDAELYARTGIQKMSINTIYQLAAFQRTQPLWQVGKILMIPDYLHYLLCGVAKTEYTNATTTGLVSAHTRDWDDEILAKCGFPREIFCEIVPPSTVLGELLPEIQNAVGFNCKVILPATHDTASAVVAVPNKDALYISSGTWSLMGIQRDTPDCTTLSRIKNFTNEGGYNNKFRYLKNIMGLWLIQQVKKELGDKHTYAELNEMAEAVESASPTPIPTIDVNDPRLLSPQNMTKTIQTLCREEGHSAPQTIGELAAVIYHSLAKSYSQTAAEIEELTGKTYDTICIVGGGAQSNYLNKLTAKYCNKIVQAGPTEATAIGNLMVQLNSKACKN
ncbi:MAG: rhamnulokinase [Defluviitaleaceae bacterium]|nr:rhamnulokinase [Defluviitaleaceae bacterium]